MRSSLISETRAERYSLVASSQRFILGVLPFRYPSSGELLDGFIREAAACSLRSADVDAVLLRCLSVLDGHTGGRLPTLVEQYLLPTQRSTGALIRFHRCVVDLLKYRGVGSSLVQQAIALIDAEYADPTLTVTTAAARLNVAASTLSLPFKKQTGLTFGHYLRAARLDRGAVLLTTTCKTIKEVWSAVGFGHASNFDHAFRDRFGFTPGEYRRRAVRPIAAARIVPPLAAGSPTIVQKRPDRGWTVLVVDDDEGMRSTIGQYLRLEGYRVVLCGTGEEALREFALPAPDVTLLDYHLPDMTGLDCLRWLRREPLAAHQAVIVFTADWDVEENATAIMALGATLAFKLCDLDEVGRLVAIACGSGAGRLGIDSGSP